MPGPRHLRFGFKTPLAVGSVFVNGGGQLSVLKPDAAYPGDLTKESDWIPAQRLDKGEVTSDGVSIGEAALWVLPPGTQTRALRFTHVAAAADAAYAGELGGAIVWSQRWSDLSSSALASASVHAQKAGRVLNGRVDGAKGWDNVDASDASADLPVVGANNAPWVLLTWPALVPLDAVNAVGAGFSAAEVQAYTGPAERHPRDAAETDWKPLGVYSGMKSGYPCPLWPNRLDLGQPVTTRALRLKIVERADEKHPHLKSAMKDGRRVWLGELMAWQALGQQPLQAVKFPEKTERAHPPIPIRFTLAEPGYVTLVIEDARGVRVRNLISETHFPAGENTAWWDGTDDLGRDLDAAQHGLYKIPARFVEPGAYTVRGLVRGKIGLHYEFSIYNGGFPAWETADKAGGWLTNHSPPQAALFVPAQQSPTGADMVYLGSAVSEGGAGLAWVDLDGKKVGGRGWIGGNWTAAPYLARDAGAQANPESFAYVGSTWTATSNNKDKTSGELRITALTRKGEDKVIIKHPFTPPQAGEGDHHWIDQLGGLAVHNGLIVASLHELGRLLFIDARTSKVLGEAQMESPRGVAFDSEGRLLVLTGGKLLRCKIDAGAEARLAQPQTLVAQGLEDPHGLTVDARGQIYVSDHGASHQVKVFTADGRLVRALGRPGAPTAGPYDPLHMNQPAGLAIDSRGRLWVTESDYLPKRVSVWDSNGALWKAFYGAAKYGGGGTLDPQDKTRFYYADEGRGAIEFKLDWEKGESQVASIYYRRERDSGGFALPDRSAAPETAIYHGGRRYFANCYNSSPTGGSTAFVFVERGGVARPAAGLGRATSWDLLQAREFASRWPAGVDVKKNPPLYLWSDRNDDGQVQPAEVTIEAAALGGVTVLPDLSLCAARVGERTVRFAPQGFTPGGAPLYDFAKGETLAERVQAPGSSGGDQALPGPDGWTAMTLGMEPFARHSLSGAKDGQPRWSYPNLWPGLHAGHRAPTPSTPGELIAPTRLLGGLVSLPGSDAGPLWAVNGNLGTVYVFTYDGLFVATLFADKRLGKPWTMPAPARNMSLDGLTLSEENFWPTWSQTQDGKIYLMNGAKSSLVRIDGLEKVRRLPATPLRVSAADLQKAQTYLLTTEAQRQQEQGSGVLTALLRREPPVVDGALDDWRDAAWIDIDKSGVAANFNANSKPYDITAALSIAGDRLYAAFRTGDDQLLQNSGEIANAPFKTGGALDFMLGADPAANPQRSSPAPGDLRLLVTMVKGKPKAVLYRAVVPGTKEPVPFSSPWRTVTLDRVDDVSTQVQLAGSGGAYEFSIPLAALGFKPEPNRAYQADLGILRGNGLETTARVYWSNKATGITSDVPSEAMLAPLLWGRLEIKAAP